MLHECQMGVDGECSQPGVSNPSSCRNQGYSYCDAKFAPNPGSECISQARLGARGQIGLPLDRPMTIQPDQGGPATPQPHAVQPGRTLKVAPAPR